MEAQPVKFYHSTICKVCTKDEPCVNTHRTDFVGHAHANKIFNVISPKTYFPDVQLRSNISQLQDLAEKLIMKQGANFFLNEFPEECEHLQYIDLDENIPDELLGNIIMALEALTEDGKIRALRNTVSGNYGCSGPDQ